MPLPPLSQYQLGYLAGIIDGEGSIQLNRRGVNSLQEGQFQPRVIIFNTNLMILSTIQEWLGGDIGIHQAKYPNRKVVYHLHWLKQDKILEILEVIEPYLIAKKAQAQLLMSWVRQRKTVFRGEGEADGILEEIHRLNSRGGD